MGFFDKFKKKQSDVPSELPALALNSLKKSSNETFINKAKKANEDFSDPSLIEDLRQEDIISSASTLNEEDHSFVQTNKFIPPSFNKLGKNEEDHGEKIKEFLENDEKGFFKDLLKNINEESKSLDKIDDWYSRQFTSDDLVHNMREYWDKQKPELVMKFVGNELKEKLHSQTTKLHDLEKDWQRTYFELMRKENEIREGEQELKQTLHAFMDLCRKHLGEESEQKIKRKNIKGKLPP